MADLIPIPAYLKIWYRIRRILVKLHILKPLQWSWYELPSKTYVNPRAVRVVADTLNKDK